MTRGKKNEIIVASFIGVLVLGAIASVSQNSLVLAVIIVVLLIGGAVLLFMPQACDLCGSQLKRSVYQWTIDGEKKKVCPNCNRGLERRKSKEARGFLYDGGVFTPIDVPGASRTAAYGINPSGQIVGFYGDSSTGAQRGFLATPKKK